MKNRITRHDAGDEYEEWADSTFELAFGYHEDVATLVYGEPHPEDAEDYPHEDFNITQSPEQLKRLVDLIKKRMN